MQCWTSIAQLGGWEEYSFTERRDERCFRRAQNSFAAASELPVGIFDFAVYTLHIWIQVRPTTDERL